MNGLGDGVRSIGTAALVLGAALLTSACATNRFVVVEQQRDTSHFGNYLAARHAGSLHENDVAAGFYAEALQDDPENPIIIERAFLLAITAGEMSRAISFAEEMLTRTPDERTARLLLSLRDLRGGAYGSAIEHIDQAAPGPFTALIGTLTKSWAEAGQGNREQALAGVSSFEGRPAFDLFRFYHEALILDLLGDAAGAEAAYRKAADATGDASLRVIQAYGNFLERQGRFDDARTAYEKHAELAPHHPIIKALLEEVENETAPPPLVERPAEGVAEALYGLGSALAQESGIEISILYLQLALYLQPDFDVARTLLADIYEVDGRWDDAITAYRQIPAGAPLYENARIQIAVNLDRLDRSEEAVALLQDLAERDPDAIEPVVTLGDILRGREDYEEAATYYARAMEIAGEPQPRHWSLYYARGICYERLGRWPEAERDLKVALDLSEEHPLVLNYLGYSWIDQNVHLDEGMEMIRKAVKARPNDGFIVDSLGWAHYRLGEYEKAVEYLERAVVLQPDDPIINDHLGDALWQVGRRLEARFQWQHALELEPEEKFEPVIRAKLEFGLDAGEESAAGRDVPNLSGS